jgi:hypothetical protein
MFENEGTFTKISVYIMTFKKTHFTRLRSKITLYKGKKLYCNGWNSLIGAEE